MTSTITVDPPNGFVWIADILREEGLPDFPTESGIAATASCVAFACDFDTDRGTTFKIGSEPKVSPGGRPDFDGVIETPNRKVTVWTVELKKLLEAKVPTERTRVRIWGNRPRFPDEVVIGLG